jgi:hypothetical protein
MVKASGVDGNRHALAQGIRMTTWLVNQTAGGTQKCSGVERTGETNLVTATEIAGFVYCAERRERQACVSAGAALLATDVSFAGSRRPAVPINRLPRRNRWHGAGGWRKIGGIGARVRPHSAGYRRPCSEKWLTRGASYQP